MTWSDDGVVSTTYDMWCMMTVTRRCFIRTTFVHEWEQSLEIHHQLPIFFCFRVNQETNARSVEMTAPACLPAYVMRARCREERLAMDSMYVWLIPGVVLGCCREGLEASSKSNVGGWMFRLFFVRTDCRHYDNEQIRQKKTRKNIRSVLRVGQRLDVYPKIRLMIKSSGQAWKIQKHLIQVFNFSFNLLWWGELNERMFVRIWCCFLVAGRPHVLILL